MNILDGRKSFYQWDSNQKITSNTIKVGDEFHITNIRQPNAMVLIAYEFKGKVVIDVPNILLQNACPILVYRYITTPSGNSTIEKYTFEVIQRPKPDDYVYTETDVASIKELVDAAVKEAVKDGDFNGQDGKDGEDGKDGKDGISATHSWNGTVLTITSASGTSSADLKGEKGDKGEPGKPGEKGADGEQGIQGIQGIQGVPGKDGKDGKDGEPGTNGKDGQDGVNGQDGYTPVKGVDYFTEADKTEMVSLVLAALPDGDEVSY